MEFLYQGVLITNPALTECGRFEVKPLEYYGTTYKIALMKQLTVATAEYKKASSDMSIEDLCHPIDYANPPFYILEKLGKDVQQMSEHCTMHKFCDKDIVWYLEGTVSYTHLTLPTILRV